MLTNRDKLNALMYEARRRGVTYGELSARLTPEETERIYRRYMGWRGTQNESQWSGSVGSNEKKTIDTERAKELYEDGLNDREIAYELGVTHGSVYRWRKREGLPPVPRKRRYTSGQKSPPRSRGGLVAVFLALRSGPGWDIWLLLW